MVECTIKYYGGNEEWIELNAVFDKNVLVDLPTSDVKFLPCEKDGKLLLINTEMIYTIEQIPVDEKGCY